MLIFATKLFSNVIQNVLNEVSNPVSCVGLVSPINQKFPKCADCQLVNI